jgi:NAD(P)-dependent dehydrogenase (short-subunit alcohol dehydrogenase family)
MSNSAPTSTWFITGSSSGFGRAFADYALAQGYNVVATARSTDKLGELTSRVPDRVLALPLDVTKHEQITAAVAAAVARFGRIDVLINNAGYGIVGAVEETPDAELRAQLETNFFGAVSMITAVLPQMRAQKSGAIVNMSSSLGQVSFGGFSAYSASKFALEGLSEALAAEAAPFGIKVLIAEPGAFRTSFAAEALKHMPVHPAYAEIVGGIRTFAKEVNGAQDGDPMKAARAIDIALHAETTPLRLPLGADAVSAIRTHAEQMLNDLKTWETIALDTKVETGLM